MKILSILNISSSTLNTGFPIKLLCDLRSVVLILVLDLLQVEIANATVREDDKKTHTLLEEEKIKKNVRRFAVN